VEQIFGFGMSKRYSVKEIFYTLQGEGVRAGRAAVFLRFAGCNLWSDLERDRQAAVCRFCDTDFIGMDGEGGGRFASAAELADAVAHQWPGGGRPYVVCTGGEPTLQLDDALVTALHERGFEIAIETNGTLPVPDGVDWVCVSPKGRAPVVQTRGDELKLVYPQEEPEAQPERFVDAKFAHFILQPLDVIGDRDASRANLDAATRYCMAHPEWCLGLQTHKVIGIP
jgi:7-carboxy-7-deazaguanine synthase (Cx14CxxC type)